MNRLRSKLKEKGAPSSVYPKKLSAYECGFDPFDPYLFYSSYLIRFKTAGNLLIILEEFYRIYPDLIKEKPKDVNM